MRLIDDCPIAPTLPITIVVTASTASAGAHSFVALMRAVSNSRSRTPKAAAFVATAMNAVIGVGAPSYTSGVHWWNPEEKSAMELVIQKGKEVGATMVMATDPDTDRVGIGVRKSDGDFILLNGNQAFCLMMYFILKNLKDKRDAYIAKTIVTSELVDTMAARLGVECYNTLTGFKYIAELMGKLEGTRRFVAAGEESYGYMVGDFVRDKDAVSACAFFAAMAANATDEGKSMYDWLIDMYVEFGYYKETLLNITKKGQQGEQEIKSMMEKFRSNPPCGNHWT